MACPGMRERATLIGGKLTIWSEVDAGTEVELRLPARHRLRDSSESVRGCRESLPRRQRDDRRRS